MSDEGGYYWNVTQHPPSRNCRDLFVAFFRVMDERDSWGFKKGGASKRRMGQCVNQLSEDDLLLPKVFSETGLNGYLGG